MWEMLENNVMDRCETAVLLPGVPAAVIVNVNVLYWTVIKVP